MSRFSFGRDVPGGNARSRVGHTPARRLFLVVPPSSGRLLNHKDARPAIDQRHLLLLEELGRHQNVSQRDLGEEVGMAASVVNRLIRELVSLGHVRVVNDRVRPFAYQLTGRGREYHHRMRYEHVQSVVGTFREVQERIRRRLREMEARGVRRVVLYGTGEVMEVTYPLAEELGLDVVGLVDDDTAKHGTRKRGHVICGAGSIPRLGPDAVLITTFRHARGIAERMGDVAWEAVVVEV